MMAGGSSRADVTRQASSTVDNSTPTMCDVFAVELEANHREV